MQDLSDKYLDTCRAALRFEQARSLAETDGWSHVDRHRVHADWDALYRTLAAEVDDADASSSEVQEIVAQHYAIASRFYAPSREAYIGMGLFYDEDSDMRDFHNAYHPNMAEFLGTAMSVYARRNLQPLL